MDEFIQESIDWRYIQKKYNDTYEIWNSSDRWHIYTRDTIYKYIEDFFLKNNEFNKEIVILNSGSGGNNYNIKRFEQIHIDIAGEKLKGIPNAIIANIENIPIKEKTFDGCLCVGDVINFSYVLKVIPEFRRILKKNGFLILEFENSRSFEFIFNKRWFNKNAAIVSTFDNNVKEFLWVYSEKYIKNVLETNNFKLTDKKYFHIVSPLIYNVTKNEIFSSHFAKLDNIAKRIPFFRTFSSNIIFTCWKDD